MCAQAQVDVPDCENNDFLQTRMINSIFIYLFIHLFLLSRSAAQDQIGTSRSTRPAACGVYKEIKTDETAACVFCEALGDSHLVLH